MTVRREQVCADLNPVQSWAFHKRIKKLTLSVAFLNENTVRNTVGAYYTLNVRLQSS